MKALLSGFPQMSWSVTKLVCTEFYEALKMLAILTFLFWRDFRNVRNFLAREEPILMSHHSSNHSSVLLRTLCTYIHDSPHATSFSPNPLILTLALSSLDHSHLSLSRVHRITSRLLVRPLHMVHVFDGGLH